jgi:hypothetical protein
MPPFDCFRARTIPVSATFTVYLGVPFEIGFNRKPTTAQRVRAYVGPFSGVFRLVDMYRRALTGIDMSAQRTRPRERLCAIRTLMFVRSQFPPNSLTSMSLVFGGDGGKGRLHCMTASVVHFSPQLIAVDEPLEGDDVSDHRNLKSSSISDMKLVPGSHP